jgi:hypothetical protein
VQEKGQAQGRLGQEEEVQEEEALIRRGFAGRRRCLTVLMATVLSSTGLFAVTASAQAATTLGQTGPAAVCSDGFGQVQDAGGSAPGYTIPTDGVITSFSATTDSASSHLVQLLILQPVSGTTYNVVAQSSADAFSGPGAHAFPTQISVKAGQVIGDWGYICSESTSNAADHFHYFNGGDPSLGAPQAFPIASPGGVRANLSATLEPSAAAPTGQRVAALKKCKKKKSAKARKKCRKKAKKLPV